MMRHRCATSEQDKIAGLNYLFFDTIAEGQSSSSKEMSFPMYVVGGDVETAWLHFVEALPGRDKADLFFFFPEPRDCRDSMDRFGWVPTWEQLKRATTLSDVMHGGWNGGIQYDYGLRQYWLDQPYLRCCISGFQIRDPGARKGLIRVQDGSEWLQFGAVADHDELITDGKYTLLTSGMTGIQAGSEYGYIRCVVGMMTRAKAFKKTTVIDIQMTGHGRQWQRVLKSKGRIVLI